MCGLAGVAVFGGAPLPVAATPLLDAMTEAVAHRGPDAQITAQNGAVGLGFSRLSLVAPDSGDQPISNADGTVVLMANGEIYNHRALARDLPNGRRLANNSDCAVLVPLYEERGLQFLNDANGMFAIVVHDVRRNHLILARDRFGIKPLYFHRTAERIVFASEIKALFLDPDTPRAVDWAAALASPVLQSAPVIVDNEPIGWFVGIEYVAPGTVLDIDLTDGHVTTHEYWKFPGAPRELPASDLELVELYGDLLADSVAMCADADAELGLLLSGGVDSAAVAALAVRITTPHTFTILNASTVESGDAYYSDLVARRLGLPNHQVHIGPEDYPKPDAWLRFLWLMEHPMAGPEAYLKHELHRYARAVRPDLKGMLLGAASDEFNGGYAPDFAGGGGWAQFEANLAGMVHRGAADTLAARWDALVGAPVLRPPDAAEQKDPYALYLQAQYRKVHQYNVWHEDRSAAGSGIEARVPFLDHRLIELSAAIPPAQRERLLFDKRILRDAVRDILPPEIASREKIPFVHGPGVRHTQQMVLRILGQDGACLVDRALDTPGAKEFLDARALRQVLRQAEEGHEPERAELTLRLVNLGLLDSLVTELPAALIRTPAPAVLTAHRRPTEAAQLRDLERAVLGYATVPADAVLVWADNVLLLNGGAERFLLCDGTIEYVLSQDNPAWYAVAGEIDGVRDLRALLTQTGFDYADIEEELQEAHQTGLLRTAGAAG